MSTNRTRLPDAAPGPQGPPIADLIDHLSRFDGPPQQFLEQLLAVQCVISWASAGAILRPGQNGQPEILAVYPPLREGEGAPTWLAQSVEFLPQAAASTKTQVRAINSPDALYGQVADKFLALLPVRGGSGVRGMAAFVVETGDGERLQSCCQRLELSLSLLSLYEMRLTLQRRQLDLQRLRVSMEILSAVNEPEKLAGVAMAMCNETAARWQCHRVGIGFLRGRYVHLTALSHTEKFSRKMKLVQDIEAAMEECLDQDVELVYPLPEGSTFVSRATGELSRMQGPSAVLCVPLRRRGEVVGVVTLERPLDKPFNVEEIETLRLCCDLNTARLVNLYEHDRWFGARMVKSSRDAMANILGPKHTWIKLIVLLVFALGLFMIFAKGDYQAEGTFTLEATQRHMIPAPFDGFLQSVLCEPGDPIVAGQVLAKLKTDELQGQLVEAQKEYETNLRQAQAADADASRGDARKINEAQQARAQAKKAQAKIDVLNYRISKAEIKSEVDGRIAAGDLKSKIGSPVRTGDTLFEVSPLEKLRAEVYIPEDQISDVRERFDGELATAAHPEQRLPFKVVRINPTAELVNQKNVFKVRVEFKDVNVEALGLKPGMEGIAKINVERRSYANLWTRKLVNWVRMKLWI